LQHKKARQALEGRRGCLQPWRYRRAVMEPEGGTPQAPHTGNKSQRKKQQSEMKLPQNNSTNFS